MHIIIHVRLLATKDKTRRELPVKAAPFVFSHIDETL